MILYELAKKYQKILEMAGDEDVFDGDLIRDSLDSVEGSLEEEIINLLKVVKEIDVNVQAIGEEIERLQKRKRSFQDAQKEIKRQISEVMIATDTKKIKNETFTVWIQKSGIKANVYDVDSLPDKFKKVKVEPDIKAIKEEWKEKHAEWLENKELTEAAGLDFEEDEPEITGVEFSEGEKGVRFR